MNKKVSVMTEKEKNKGKKLSEIIFGDKYTPADPTITYVIVFLTYLQMR